jgi:hypothetical protein
MVQHDSYFPCENNKSQINNYCYNTLHILLLYYIMIIRKFGCLTENLLIREIIRLTTQTYNRRHKEVPFLVRVPLLHSLDQKYCCCLLQSKKHSRFFEHFKSSLGIAKHLLPSYEVSVKWSTLERLFFLGLKSSRISTIPGLTTSIFASPAGNNCIMSTS